ncbi:hypothetical protein CCYN49044_250024 [Capnocytophaga cynodegmi]|uniref:Uncharacterized protein n=1 Tax=Capnocytophaga cynodegmi TaxID=28189 RepID=A0A0B7HGR5_9FLAO|nr:hypothetical protein CCYN74_110010 [Capnocytophaga cynodegmi]CEN38921.1 hypothetical protein CCYN49044_250024 [Capnocytophaga cynodegmi]
MILPLNHLKTQYLINYSSKKLLKNKIILPTQKDCVHVYLFCTIKLNENNEFFFSKLK